MSGARTSLLLAALPAYHFFCSGGQPVVRKVERLQRRTSRKCGGDLPGQQVGVEAQALQSDKGTEPASRDFTRQLVAAEVQEHETRALCQRARQLASQPTHTEMEEPQPAARERSRVRHHNLREGPALKDGRAVALSVRQFKLQQRTRLALQEVHKLI